MVFEAAQGFSNVGMVKIPLDSIMLINDGQHRRRGVELALEQDPTLKDQTLSVVMFYDEGLQRSQQIFADINSQMVKPPKALSILFDRTNVMNKIIVGAIDTLNISHAIEFEKASPASKSLKVWGISAIKKAAEYLTGLNDKKAAGLSKDEVEAYTQLLARWLSKIMLYSGGALETMILNGDKTIFDARLYRVITHAVYLHSVAVASRSLLGDYHPDSQVTDKQLPDFEELAILSNLPVLKTDDVWQGRMINKDGTMNPTTNGIKLSAYVMLERMGKPIPETIQEINDLVFNS